MGIMKHLSPVSAHAAKKTTLWSDLEAAIERCMTPEDLKDFQASLDPRELEIPAAWWGPIRDRIELRAEEIASEDIGKILRDRFDF